MRWLVTSAVLLVVTGVVQLVGSVLAAILVGSLLGLDPGWNLCVSITNAGFFGGAMIAGAAALTVVDIGAATGIVLRQPWAWWLGVFLGLAYLPTWFFPVGVLQLLILTRDDVRYLFTIPLGEPIPPRESVT